MKYPKLSNSLKNCRINSFGRKERIRDKALLNPGLLRRSFPTQTDLFSNEVEYD